MEVSLIISRYGLQRLMLIVLVFIVVWLMLVLFGVWVRIISSFISRIRVRVEGLIQMLGVSYLCFCLIMVGLRLSIIIMKMNRIMMVLVQMMIFRVLVKGVLRLKKVIEMVSREMIRQSRVCIGLLLVMICSVVSMVMLVVKQKVNFM